MGSIYNKKDHMNQTTILDKFPKKRIRLPEAFQKIYNQQYLCNREGKYKTTLLSQKLESWMHKKVTEDVAGGNQKLSPLEREADTLNQLQCEPVQDVYDIVESLYLSRQCPLSSQRFDRQILLWDCDGNRWRHQTV